MSSALDAFHRASPPPPPTASTAPVNDLARILSLPIRTPVDCKRDAITRRYPPATQALIEVMTARFARPKRVSCACRPRRIEKLDAQRVRIWRMLPEGFAPELPIETTVAALEADNRTTAEEINFAQQVAAMRPGTELAVNAAYEANGYPCITEFNGVQAWTLKEAVEVGGIIAFSGVGSGKTVSNILMPMAFPELHAQNGQAPRTAALLIEPKQRLHYKSHYLRLREHFRVSSIVFDDGTNITVPGTPPLHLISYSKLSHKLQSDLLERLNPDLLGADEGHRACGDSAINRRFKRFLAHKIRMREDALARGEQVLRRATILVVQSGTLEKDSVEDTQMVCAYALGTGSPLPLDKNEAKAWSAVFDNAYDIDRSSKTAKALYKAFGNGVNPDDYIVIDDSDGPENAVREGFQQRRAGTLGIITANAPDVNAAIYICERKISKIPPKIVTALADIRQNWRRPDGEEFDDKMLQVSCAREIAAGYFNFWTFPKHPCTCPKNRELYDPKCSECQLIDEWFVHRKAYNKELRRKLSRGERFLDSAELCRSAAERFWQEPPYKGDLPKWDCESFPKWRDIENRVEYTERAEWIDDYMARDAADWALKNKGVVWFLGTPMGRKLEELTGLPYFNGGPGVEQRMRAEKGDRSILVSLSAHGNGTDGLQHIFSEQLLVEMPSSNATAQGFEQVLGRLHREGQRADIVYTHVYTHVTEFTDQLYNARLGAQFNYTMTKNVQKILCANFDFEF